LLVYALLLRSYLRLQLAKQQGDFLLVGLHTDEDVEARRGPHTPIMNVHERALSVLACKYVDEVRPGRSEVWEQPAQLGVVLQLLQSCYLE
jgi:cytidyltransferase-like protein